MEASLSSWQLELLTFITADSELRDVASRDGLLRVLEDGLSTVWNINNPTRAIAAGDRILEVNGEALSPED